MLHSPLQLFILGNHIRLPSLLPMPPALPPSPQASLSVDVESWDIFLGMVFEAFNREMLGSLAGYLELHCIGSGEQNLEELM